jgi:hypothetical protein
VNKKLVTQSETQKVVEKLRLNEGKDFRPSEFMRARRPELFSDSKVNSEPYLTKAVFEYHLDTLTSRKQETEFEHFCRRLSEKELCSNLLPQTGPTGGGDSKVDTETYPVADNIALRWYEGIGRDASHERWGFAFSAKKKWAPKARSDVEKISRSNRGYKHIYFITNQFIKDKTRAQVEEELTKKHRISVRILDRGWIVKCVFENDRIRLAAETLNLIPYQETSRRAAGARDTEREAELKEIDEQINNDARYQDVEYQLAEDCLHTALLARGLERPRVEVDGRFLRAERIANRVGHRQQQQRIAYAKAWTAFWWYDDFEALNLIYDAVEQFALDSVQIEDVELLGNLWTVMHTSIAMGKLNAEKAKFGIRTSNLQQALDRLCKEDRRPTTALQARTLRTLMELTETLAKNIKQLDPVFNKFKAILGQSEHLASFPIAPLSKIIRELGDRITDSSAYDSLFEDLIKITSKRANEIEVGNALLQRGLQKLTAGKNYEAIRLLGRAQQSLAKEESRREWIITLAVSASAYEQAGLLWAARAYMIAACSLAFADFSSRGALPPQVLRCLQRLIWMELQLGRVPCVLMWLELTSYAAHHLLLDGERREKYSEERNTQDIVLGLLLLRVDFWESKDLDFLPDILANLHLELSRMAVLYVLGYEERLREEHLIPASEDATAVQDFFQHWVKQQPVAKDVATKPDFLARSNVQFSSTVLGCKFIVECSNQLDSIYLSETILATIEAFLATSMAQKIFPHRESFLIRIVETEFGSDLPECSFQEKYGAPNIEIRHAKRVARDSQQERTRFQSWLIDLLAQIIGRTFAISNVQHFLSRVAGEEIAFSRALNYSDVKVAIENIFGRSPKYQLADWSSMPRKDDFPLIRASSWNEGISLPENTKRLRVPPSFAKGDPPDDLRDPENFRHGDITVISFINQELWDKAKWEATGYIDFQEGRPPGLVLCFTDDEAGISIFNEWRGRIGGVDSDERLRVAIVTGVDRIEPFSYSVVIGPNLNLTDEKQPGLEILVSRINRMIPTDHKNLNRFLEKYKEIGSYLLMPARFSDPSSIRRGTACGIIKRELIVRPAWEIGENDPDLSAIKAGDDPIIPDGTKEPPIRRALKKWGKQGFGRQ